MGQSTGKHGRTPGFRRGRGRSLHPPGMLSHSRLSQHKSAFWPEEGSEIPSTLCAPQGEGLPPHHPTKLGKSTGKIPIRDGFVLFLVAHLSPRATSMCWELGHGVVFSLSPSYSGIAPCPVPGSWHRIRSSAAPQARGQCWKKAPVPAADNGKSRIKAPEHSVPAWSCHSQAAAGTGKSP